MRSGATAQSTSNLIVLGATENAAHSFTFSSPSLSSQANTVASVDLTLGGTATAVADFEVRFTMANPELVFTSVTKGPALSAAGCSVLVWKRGDTYTVAGFYAGSGTASAMAPGKVATLNFKVVPAGAATKATDGVTAMHRVRGGAAVGNVDAIYGNPLHPYTRALLSARPTMDPRKRTKEAPIQGDPPNPIDPPSGCRLRGSMVGRADSSA